MPQYKIHVYEAWIKKYFVNAKNQDEARQKIEDEGAMFGDDGNKIYPNTSKIEEFRIEEVEEV